MRQTPLAWTLGIALLACALAGCRQHGPTSLPTERDRIEMLSLMLPQEIKILPFTKVKSFNEDELPDGILAVVRPLDRFGDPVKAAGLFYFELWTYQNASQERKGERVAFWERRISTPQEVRMYWTHAQMYEFQLAWAGGAEEVKPGRKYVLTATYRTPWDETIRDEYVMEFNLPPRSITTSAPAQ
jgi:hypothetical protein